jgi:hypothetical protein
MNYARKIESLIKELEELPILAEIIADEEMETQFPKMVREQVKVEGENDKGELIQAGYSTYWGNIRGIEGLQIEYVDLYYTGAFLNNLSTIKSGEEYYLTSNVPYLDELTDRYEGILGLQDDNLSIIVREIKKKLLKELRNGR